VPDPAHSRAPDLVNRKFTADAPGQLHVADFTCVPLDGGGFGYAAFVIDVYAGLIAARRTARDPARGSALAEKVTGGRARRAGASARAGLSLHRAGSSAFAPAAHGGLPPVRSPWGTARHRLAAVTPAARSRTGTGNPPQRSSLEPSKIAVKGALRASHVMPCGHPGL
jgi:transposase InsO family protein